MKLRQLEPALAPAVENGSIRAAYVDLIKRKSATRTTCKRWLQAAANAVWSSLGMLMPLTSKLNRGVRPESGQRTVC